MPDIDSVWARIKSHENDTFETKTGKQFSYTVAGNVLRPSRTEYNLPRSEFEKALPLVPIEKPGEINDLVRGPAYIWAILHDSRIRMKDW